MKSISELQAEVIEEFEDVIDWEERFQILIEMGEALPPYPEDKKKDDYLVPGCQSRVWVAPEIVDGKLFFYADSDTSLTKGLIAILVKVFSGHSPEEISNSNLDFIEQIGLQKFLSISRRNGLSNMIQIVMNYAKT
ncbi:SufE family protein [Leptospira sp. GIMC2001]|uniref:SufE family protein n=1 Tax=Leptospira sp. GIMC2001 TaxID=1513297 RepID=UPI00234B5190|nr:SufE family protein [Leptospira sp. GIMC2001]WCL49139.1 SufE family protein [Leptospira sp. GIMC2001]